MAISNTDLLKAIRVLQKYCEGIRHCDSCVFSSLRDDMGMYCKINQLVDDDRFYEVLNASDQTVTISSDTIQYQPLDWSEFDDDL